MTMIAPAIPAKPSTLNDPQAMRFKQHLADLWRYLNVTIDLESTDLNHKYGMPTQIAARVTTLARQELARTDFRVRVPEYSIQSPAAAIITQSFPHTIHYGEDRLPPHIAAARIADLFTHPYRTLWDAIDADTVVLTQGLLQDDYVHVAPRSILPAIVAVDFASDATHVRLHDNGRFVSYPLVAARENITGFEGVYREPDATLWRKVKTKSLLPKDIDYEELWANYASQRTRITFAPVKEEIVRLYTYLTAEGQAETLRLHNHGKQISRPQKLSKLKPSYLDLDGGAWDKVFAPSNSSGFNSIGFDSRMLKQQGFISLLPEIIFDRLKDNHLFQSDIRVMLKAVVALSAQGSEGVQPGIATSPKNGQSFTSFGLSATMEANGPAQHGLDRTIRMPDGSLYDRRLGHVNALYDIDATDALQDFLRSHDPDVVRQTELNADLERYQTFLIGHDGFEDRPLRTFFRNNFPHMPRVHMGICLGIEQDIQEVRQALMVRTDIRTPVEEYSYKGKLLFGSATTPAEQLMSQADIETMFNDMRTTAAAEPIFETINLRRNHAVFEGDLAHERGKIGDPEWQIRQRTALLESFAAHGRHNLIMQALRATTVDFSKLRDETLTRIEEETHTRFQKPKTLYLMTPDGERPAPDAINAHAENIWDQANNIDYVLRRVLGGPEPLEWFEALPQEKWPEILDDFLEKMKKAKKDLAKYQTQFCDDPIMLVGPDENLDPQQEPKDKEEPPSMQAYCKRALDYLWKLRAVHRANFNDVTNSYRVYDRYGHEVPAADLLGTHESILGQKLATGDYTIRFEQLRYSSEQIARMFLTTPGRLEWIRGRLKDKIAEWSNAAADTEKEEQHRQEKVTFYQRHLKRWDLWEEHQHAVAALHLWGPPHLEVRNHPWMSGARALEEIKDIRANLRQNHDQRATEDELGLWEVLMANRDRSDEILSELERHIRAMMKKYPLTPERKNMMGYHDKNSYHGDKNRPIEAVKYIIPAHQDVVLLDVPDALLEKPLRHIEKGSNLIPLLIPSAEAQRHIDSHGTTLLLRGSESGKVFLAAKAKRIDTIRPSPWFDDLYAEADQRYAEAGLPPVSTASAAAWVKTERAPIETPLALYAPDQELQTVKLRVPGFFDATVSTRLSQKPVLMTGFITRLDVEPPMRGPARLMEMVATDAERHIETGWEREIDIQSVNICSLEEYKKMLARSLRLDHLAKDGGYASVRQLMDSVTRDEDAHKAGFKNLEDFRNETEQDFLTQADILSMGYQSLEEARGKVRHLFSDKNRDEASEHAQVLIVTFKQAEKASTTYHNPPRRAAQAEDSSALAPHIAFEKMPTRQTRQKILTNPGRVIRL